MGSIGGHYDKGRDGSLTEFFFGRRGDDGLYRHEPGGQCTEVAVFALVERTEWYGVIRYSSPAGGWHEWFGAIFTVHWSGGHENICYKQEEESMGSCQTRAPLNVLETLEALVPLKVLTPDEQTEVARLKAAWEAISYGSDEYRTKEALWQQIIRTDPHARHREWRSACYARLERRKKAATLKAGDRIKLSVVYDFGHLGKIDTYTLRKGRGGRLCLTHQDHPHITLRVPNWRDLHYELLKDDSAETELPRPVPKQVSMFA